MRQTLHPISLEAATGLTIVNKKTVTLQNSRGVENGIKLPGPLKLTQPAVVLADSAALRVALWGSFAT
jgi:hypothetical protein